MSEEPNVEVIKSEVAPVVALARDVVVNSPEDCIENGEQIKIINGIYERAYDTFVLPWFNAKAHAEAERKKFYQMLCVPLDQAVQLRKDKQLAFLNKCERERLEAQRKAQEEADRQAAAERARLEREAARLKTPELKSERLEMAAAVIAPVVSVLSAAPVIQGQRITRTWRAKVIDVDLVPREWMVVNMDALNAFARSTKGAVKVAGVEFVEVSGLASGR